MTTEQAAPPQSVDTEKEVIGGILVLVEAIRACVEAGLEPEHFYLSKHQSIYRAMRAIARGKAHPDELATLEALSAMGLKEGIEDHYLAMLAAESTTAFNMGQHARRLIVLAGKRAKIDGARKILAGAEEQRDGRSAELIAEGMELVASDYTTDAEPTSKEELRDDFYNFLADELPAETFTLPWHGLNRCVLGGYRRKQMSVLAGWTNMGKSFALDQLLTDFHGQGANCAIFATELDQRERIARYLTGRARVATEKLLLKRLSAEEHTRVNRVLNEGLPFDYYNVNGWSYEKIAERIIFGGYDIAAVDVINLIPGFEKTETATIAIGRFAQVATRADMHLILVSHLNRARAVDRKGILPRPVKRDLRDSGMLEANAHQIMFLHRHQDEQANVLPGGEIYFDKVRTGTRGRVDVAFSNRTLTFDEMSREEAREADEELAAPSISVSDVAKPEPGDSLFETAATTPHDREPA